MTDRFAEFVGLLRDHGIAAGPSETIDAAEAMLALGLADRNHLRSGMAAQANRREQIRSELPSPTSRRGSIRGGVAL